MRIDLDLKTVDGRKNMKTGVDIDESQLKVPLEDVIGLTMRKIEEKVRKQLGLNPAEAVAPKVETPATPAPAAPPAAPPTPKEDKSR